MATTRLLAHFLGFLALLGSAWAAEAPLVRVYPGAAPTIDGALDDPCWSTATAASPFVLTQEHVLPVEQTRLLLSCGPDRLYAAFQCEAPDPEKVFVGDGDPTLNDRVELTLLWRGGERVTILVDAAGHVRCSDGLQDVKAAVGRMPRAYTVELSIPHPPKATDIQFIARRSNEVTGEQSEWGSTEAMAVAELAPLQGPIVKVGHLRRLFRPKDDVKLEVANPTPAYQTVRCAAAGRDTSLVRLDARQTLPVRLSFEAREVRESGLQLVVDDPQGQPVYLRSPSVRTPPGRPPAHKQLNVIPHPRHVRLLRTQEPFLLDARCRIIVGQRDNEVEARAAGLLQREIQEICGLDIPVQRGEYFLSYPCIVVGTRRTTLLAARVEEAFDIKLPSEHETRGDAKQPTTPSTPIGEPPSEEPPEKPRVSAGAQDHFRAPEQAYILGVGSDLIGVAALHDTGTLYGVQTLIQILASAQQDQAQLIVPAMRVRDWPALPLRGWLWSGSRPDITFMFPAFLRFKLNVVSEVPGADLASARANGVYLARLQLPPSQLIAVNRPPAQLFLTPSDDMPRSLRHSLRLPITVEEGTVKPPKAAPESGEAEPETPKKAGPRGRSSERLHSSSGGRGIGSRTSQGAERLSPPEEFEKPKAVTLAWVHGDPWALSDAAREATGRDDIVGLCGGLGVRSTLLPPSWAEIVAAAAYGWSPEGAVPDITGEAFCRTFFGSAEVAEARDLLERAVASLPRRVAIADLMDPTRPAPAPPRPDIPNLVRLAKEKAGTARRSRQVAAVLAQSADRILVASNNVVALLRARDLYGQAAQLDRGGRRPDAAARIDDLAKCLTDARARIITVLGEPAARSDDARLLAAAAVTARQIARQMADGAALPEADPFWRRLKGQTP